MNVPGFVFNPIMLAIEGVAIGFLIAVPVGPAAVLCIRRSIPVGAVAGYMTGIGAALGDAVFGAVAAFGLSFVEQFVHERERWLIGNRVSQRRGVPAPSNRVCSSDWNLPCPARSTGASSYR